MLTSRLVLIGTHAPRMAHDAHQIVEERPIGAGLTAWTVEVGDPLVWSIRSRTYVSRLARWAQWARMWEIVVYRIPDVALEEWTYPALTRAFIARRAAGDLEIVRSLRDVPALD